jgi:AraC-like DNA-binding protein
MQVSYEKILLNEQTLFLFKEFIQPRFNSPFHWHDEYELIYLKKGQGKLLVGNQAINFNEGDVYFFAPGLNHAFFNIPESQSGRKNAHAVVIQFKYNFLGENFWNKSENIQIQKLLGKSEQGIMFPGLKNEIITRICNIGKLNGISRLTELLSVLEQLSLSGKKQVLSAGETAMAGKDDSKVISDVYCYVAENFQKNITFSTAASVANMQRAAFCRYFKRKTKKKFSAFVNEVRIAHARKLLSETDRSIIEICYECGFESLSYFNRQFKLLTGYPPREFRNKMQPD